tara:strand:+ start:485 stop:637 length:153 start_codon:yes stop_codon:yes gene_type:complete
MSKQELINSLQFIVDQLKGTMEHTITVNSSGRQSKKIVIEYDVTHKNDDG